MADATTLAKLPSEPMRAFNLRLRAACTMDDYPITGVNLLVVDGEPLVTLFSELVEATAEDVALAKEDGEELDEGDDIPAKPPMIVQVALVSCATDKSATKAQERLEILYERADGGVVEILNASGVRGMVPVTYVLVSYIAGDDEEEQEGDDADDNMETAVRTPVASKS